MTVSGKIIRKWVKPGTRGNTIGFIVMDKGQEIMVSVFESKLTSEAKEVLMALVEGMYADFECVENVSNKDGKTYLNITSATPITQLRDEGVAPPVQPGGPVPKEGDTRVRSMALSYAKDMAVAFPNVSAWFEGSGDNVILIAKRFEQYILTGE